MKNSAVVRASLREGATWLVTAVVMCLVLFGVAALLSQMGGCQEWKLGDESRRQEAVAAAQVRKAQAEREDVKAIAEAETAAGVGMFEPATGEAIPVDQDKLADELAKRVSAAVLAELAAKAAAGVPLEQAAREAKLAAAKRAAEALTAAATAKQRVSDLAVEVGIARDKTDRAWGLVEWGLTIAAALGVPGVAVGAGYLGKLRGITMGATQGAQLIGTARAIDPDINSAFKATEFAPLLRQSMLRLHPLVRAAIDANKTTPLPGAETAVAQVLSQASRSGVANFTAGEIETLKQRLNELRAELEAVKADPPASSRAA